MTTAKTIKIDDMLRFEDKRINIRKCLPIIEKSMKEMDDEEDEFSTTAALAIIGCILIAGIMTFYTFLALSQTPLGWAVLIIWGAVVWAIIIVLNKRYRWIVLKDKNLRDVE